MCKFARDNMARMEWVDYLGRNMYVYEYMYIHIHIYIYIILYRELRMLCVPAMLKDTRSAHSSTA